MKKLIFLCLLLSGCSLMPTRWDESQVSRLTDIHQEVSNLDCTKNVGPQVDQIASDLEWLHQYDTYKGANDVDGMVAVEQKAVKEFQSQVAAGKSNNVYCQLKKAIILQQTDIIGHTVKGSLQ